MVGHESSIERFPFPFLVALSMHNHLAAIRRLSAVGRQDSYDSGLLAEAQFFASLALSLTEKTQADFAFWQVRRRLLQAAQEAHG